MPREGAEQLTRKPPQNPSDWNSPETIRWLAADRADHFEKCVKRRQEYGEAVEERALAKEELDRALEALMDARAKASRLLGEIGEFSEKAAHLRAVAATPDATLEMLMKEP